LCKSAVTFNFSYINYNYLPKISYRWITDTSALTTTTSAFADGNAISRVERIFAALLGQPAQTGPPPHTYKDRTD
jgi:hypothetical protein